MGVPKLSILIPTVFSRIDLFKKLYLELKRQSDPYGEDIEIISICDEKEMIIGAKRNKLYELARGIYSVQWDDDDWIHEDGIKLIMEGIEHDKDCVTYKEHCNIHPGIIEERIFSIRYKEEKQNVDGFHVVRPPSPKCVIKTKLAKKQPVRHVRYGEDGLFAWDMANREILKTEYFIDEFIYHYLNLSNEDFDFYRRYRYKYIR